MARSASLSRLTDVAKQQPPGRKANRQKPSDQLRKGILLLLSLLGKEAKAMEFVISKHCSPWNMTAINATIPHFNITAANITIPPFIIPAGNVTISPWNITAANITVPQSNITGSATVPPFNIPTGNITVIPANTTANATASPPSNRTPIQLTIANGCGESIWPGIVTQSGIGPGSGGFELTPGTSRLMFISADWAGRIWGRTDCSFNSDGSGPSTDDGVNGYGAACLTGDCFGKLNCQFAVSPPPFPYRNSHRASS